MPAIAKNLEKQRTVQERRCFNMYFLPSTSLSNHTCIGASERILDHFLSRNSDPTTPGYEMSARLELEPHSVGLVMFVSCLLDNLVPMGSPFLLISTQALSSNLIRLPSFRWISFLARTTTACRMSPRRTLFAIPKLEPPGFSGPKDLCFCTTTIILSPGFGVRVSSNFGPPATYLSFEGVGEGVRVFLR